MTYTKLTFKLQAPKPYLFIGSKVRGALGYALKEKVCINPSFVCKDCFAQDRCIFYDMYEKQNISHNYRVDFKLYDKKFKFSILLFNDLQQQSQTIQDAVITSLKEYKVKSKIKLKKLKVKKKFTNTIRLEFQTPLRIKKNNLFALNYKEINIYDILLSIHKRDLQLQNKPYKPLKFNQNIITISKYLKYKELTRKSNKQKTFMNLGGLMGHIVLKNVDKKTYKLLKKGELIGVGKSTVFGLGNYKIMEVK